METKKEADSGRPVVQSWRLIFQARRQAQSSLIGAIILAKGHPHFEWLVNRGPQKGTLIEILELRTCAEFCRNGGVSVTFWTLEGRGLTEIVLPQC